MKPWGSQPTISTFFAISDASLYAPKRELTIGGRTPPGLPREQGRWLAGVQGAAMSPLVAGTDAAKSWQGCRCVAPWVAIDYASCDAAAGHLNGAQVRWRRPSYPNTPRRSFVTDSLQRQLPASRDSQSFELTR